MPKPTFSILGAEIELGNKYVVGSESLPFVSVNYDDLDSTGNELFYTYFRGYVSIGPGYENGWNFEVEANSPQELDIKARVRVQEMYDMLGQILAKFPSYQPKEDDSD